MNGERLTEDQYDWLDDTRIGITLQLVDEDTVVFRRFTRSDQRWADYHNGATLTEDDLNIVTLQLLYLIQELYDFGLAGLSGEPPPGGGPGTGGGTDPTIIDQIITDLLATQLFQDLISLIELADINAEALISTMLNTHERWEADRAFDDALGLVRADVDARVAELLALVEANTTTIIDNTTVINTDVLQLVATVELIAANLDDATALIAETQTVIATLDSATATRFNLLQASVDDNIAQIASLDQAIVDEEGARIISYNSLRAEFQTADATFLTQLVTLDQLRIDGDSALASRVTVNESILNTPTTGVLARVGTIETTYATRDYAEAYVLQQLDTRFAPESFAGYLNASSVIIGIRTVSDAERASVESVSSFLVGSGYSRNSDGSINWNANAPSEGSLVQTLAGIQTTQDATATQLAAEATLRTALAARFAPGQQDNNPAAISAAISNELQVLVNADAGIASSVNTLIVNRQPVFFRDEPPDWSEPEFIGSPYDQDGFPEGTTWFKPVTTGLRPYIWKRVFTVPAWVPPGALFYGPYQSASTNFLRAGMWLPNNDEATLTAGARIDALDEVFVTEEEAGAISTTTLETVFGLNVNAIQARLGAFVQDDGSMYSTWNVRINQYSAENGFPTIAGFGLGMQDDPTNPEGGQRSDFIVMADYFSIIAPPEVGTPVTGFMDPGSATVPFLVDASVPNASIIYLNGDVVARKTLAAYDGMMGRLSIGQLNVATGFLDDPNGQRLVLPSSTDGFWDSNTPSPFTGGAHKFLVWAGAGDQNAQNATFYVDTDGNAAFKGEVQADNIVGTFNNVLTLQEGYGPTIHTGAPNTWTKVGPDKILPGTPGLNGRVPFATVSMNVFGSGVSNGSIRVTMAEEIMSNGVGTGAYGVEQQVAYSNIGIQDFGSTITVAGGIGTASTGKVRLRIYLGRVDNDGNDPQSSEWSGIFIGLR